MPENYVECQECGGGGELVDCRGYACSHVNDAAYTCHICGGAGEVKAVIQD